MLCDRCESHFWSFNNSPARDRYGSVTVAALDVSRLAGCYICTALLAVDVTKKFEPWPNDPHEVVHEHWHLYESRCELQMSIETPHHPPLRKRIAHKRIDLRPLQSRPGLDPAPILAPNVPESIWSTSSCDMIKTWFADCVVGHPECAQKENSAFVPPRLICLDQDTPRLVITDSSAGLARQYATLSHCWGPHPSFLTLTAENHDAFQKSLPYDRLAKTFQNAITVCKSIGVTYLWIDSLCIMQSGPGSTEDWQHHVVVMPNIYRDCCINIAAEWAISSEEGLFKLRNPLLLQSHVVVLKDKDNREESYTLYAEELEELNPSLNSAWLQTRGWVYQERLLSPRIVHFAKEQIWWECSQAANTCEKRPRGNLGEQRSHQGMTGMPGHIQPDRHASGADLIRLLNSYSGGMVKKERNEIDLRMVQSTLDYFGLIESYTARRLTYPDSDKLPAFGAIAGHYAKVFDSRYLAGCFEQHFPACLAWRVKDDHPALSSDTPSSQRPSWSWISSSSPIKFECSLTYLDRYGGGYATLANITAVRLDLVDRRNEFGQVQRAELTLQTRLIPYQHVPPDHNSSIDRGLGPEVDILITGFSSLRTETERGPRLQILYTGPDGRAYIHEIQDRLGQRAVFDSGAEPQTGTEAMRVALLEVTLLSDRAQLADADGGYMVICGLIVTPIQSSSGPRYKRVGVWEERLPHGDEKLAMYLSLPLESIVLI